MQSVEESVEEISAEKISDSLEEEFKSLRPLTDECCIYRAPVLLLQLHENLYVPRLISIGPFHHGKEQFKKMEEHKRRYLQDFLKLSKASLKDCIELVKYKEPKLRSSYAETIEFDSEEFVKMILLDSVFIIMVLLRCSFKFDELSQNDRLFTKPKMMYWIRYDMLLLENQIPFFILEDLFKLCKIYEYLRGRNDLRKEPELEEETAIMIKLAYKFFQRWGIIRKENYSENYSKPDHVLHLLRNCYIPEKWNPTRKPVKTTLRTPSISELHQAGVKLKHASKENIFDIKFTGRTLEIPRFTVSISTELLFRNLQTFEQFHCLDSVFNDYIVIMDQLVKAPKDAELLIESEILDNWGHGAEGISTLLRNLSSGNMMSINEFSYTSLIEDLNKYCAAPWPKWKATLKQDYFKNPWAIISVLAAGVLLILTIIQAVCSILQVK